GVIFGMEMISIGQLKLFAWYECLVASFVGYYTAVFLHAPHSTYPTFPIPAFSLKTAIYVAAAGAVFGLAAMAFSEGTHAIEKINRRFIQHPAMKPFIGGVLLVFFFWLEGSYRYAGLGISIIQDSLHEHLSWYDPIYKLLFSALTV